MFVVGWKPFIMECAQSRNNKVSLSNTDVDQAKEWRRTGIGHGSRLEMNWPWLSE